MTDVFADALARYKRAVELANITRKAWEDDGCPFTSIGSREQEITHPLFKAMRETELEAAKLGELLARRKPGRPVGATSAPDRPAAPPRVKLKAVGS